MAHFRGAAHEVSEHMQTASSPPPVGDEADAVDGGEERGMQGAGTAGDRVPTVLHARLWPELLIFSPQVPACWAP